VTAQNRILPADAGNRFQASAGVTRYPTFSSVEPCTAAFDDKRKREGFCKSRPAVRGTDHFFTPAASPRNKASLDERLALRSAALAIVGLSLLGWAILLIFVFRLLGNS
jgi:hypothetical protein